MATYATTKLLNWQRQAARLEVDRQRLHYVPPMGFALGLAAAAFTRAWWPFAAAFGLAVVTWGMGQYMVAVRRQEYDYQIGEAQKEVQAEP